MPGSPVGKPKVGHYYLTSEVSRVNRVMYYVVKILDINNDKAKCEWFSFRDQNKLFVKLEAKWEILTSTLLREVGNPKEVGRRKRILFRDVYRFLVGRDFE